ncbi:2Fe-2S iron-sulfur cluster-binding protein [Natronincola ferrireducens]|uniref:2Fe-2S iron-sulfur cluster binding domain-containing protein n=1 Tax=Natronincola ferrireducens TaxID=393762 RepID=A0A1G9A0W1_9FIRM|nr:2Fe-2S iron-sulfur cluster-binding protein [Natronincola ferrireducens]SDK21019.1 2Fe-2S iron-sulfur cluster binding domain-containing protein [Natronincola ferrireducens]
MIVKIHFKKSNKTIEVFPGNTLLSVARDHHIFIPSPCGGNARCGGCRIRVLQGKDLEDISAEEYLKLSDEQIEKGFRLACSYVIKEDIEVDI